MGIAETVNRPSIEEILANRIPVTMPLIVEYASQGIRCTGQPNSKQLAKRRNAAKHGAKSRKMNRGR